MKTDSIESSFEATIANSDLQEISTDILELAIDSILEEGLLKDVPLMGWVLKAGKIYASVRDRLLTKKILLFLYKIKDIPVEERSKFIEKLESNEDFKQDIGERLLLLLDNLDDTKKASLIGNLYKACITDKIDYETFMRLSQIVDKSFYPDLEKFKSGSLHSGTIKENLANLGLMQRDITPSKRFQFGHTNAKQEFKYKKTYLAHELLEHAFD